MFVPVSLCLTVVLPVITNCRTLQLIPLLEEDLVTEYLSKPMQKTASRIFSLAIPVIVSQISLTFVQIVDTMFLGRLGPIQLGATALVGVLLWNLINVGEGFSVGLTACIARMIGAGDDHQASSFFRSGLVGITILGILLVPILLLLEKGIFLAMRMPGELYTYGSEYFIWFVVFLPSIYFLTATQAAFRAAGDTRAPMIVGFIMNGINVLLDYLFIFGKLGFPEMGVHGAALASGISYTAGWIMLFSILNRRSWGPLHKGSQFSLDKLFRIVKFGIPATIERLAMSVSQLMVMALSVTPLGSYYIASFHIVIRLASLSFMPGFGFAISAATMAGQSLGAKRPEEAEKLVWHTVMYAALVMAGISILYYSLPTWLVRLFTNSEEIVAISKSPLRIYATMVVFLSLSMVLGGGLRGAGDTKYPMIIMFLSRFAIRLPLSWILSIHYGLGLSGVWMAMCTDFVIRAGLLSLRMRSGNWKKIRI